LAAERAGWLRRKRDNEWPVIVEEPIGTIQECGNFSFGELCEGVLDGSHVTGAKHDLEATLIESSF
jgi:hypothetical protein